MGSQDEMALVVVAEVRSRHKAVLTAFNHSDAAVGPKYRDRPLCEKSSVPWLEEFGTGTAGSTRSIVSSLTGST